MTVLAREDPDRPPRADELRGIHPAQTWLDGHLVLARRIDSPRFRRIEEYSPRNVLHAFRLTSPADVDEEFAAWLAEAYEVGEQRLDTIKDTIEETPRSW